MIEPNCSAFELSQFEQVEIVGNSECVLGLDALLGAEAFSSDVVRADQFDYVGSIELHESALEGAALVSIGEHCEELIAL